MDRKKLQYLWPHCSRETSITWNKSQFHAPHFPLDYWFQYSHEGTILFVVFYSRRCRWAKCLGCSFPQTSAPDNIDFKALMRQVDFIFDTQLNSWQKLALKKIILSNNGSILDTMTFPRLALLYFITRMKEQCPYVSLLTIETRIEYVVVQELQYIAAALKEGNQPTELEFAVGVEVFHEETRNQVYKKGLTNQALEHFAAEIAGRGYRLKTYFMLKPVPDMSEEEATTDIVKAIGYLDTLSRKLQLKINLHLNVTFVAERTLLAEAFKHSRYTPPHLESAIRAVLAAEDTALTVYIGVDDEGRAKKNGDFISEGDQPLIEAIRRFNQSLDYTILKNALKNKER